MSRVFGIGSQQIALHILQGAGVFKISLNIFQLVEQHTGELVINVIIFLN